MITAADFRIRKTTRGFIISQRVGNGWERLADPPPNEGGGLAFITAAHRPQPSPTARRPAPRFRGGPLCVAAGVARALLVVG